MDDERPAARRPLRGIVALLFAFLLVGSAVAVFLIARRPAPVDLRLRFDPGEVLRFHMVMDVSGVTLSGATPIQQEDEIQADVTWQVVGVDGSGTATVVQTVSNPTMHSNGAPVTLADFPPTKMTVSADGRVGASSGVDLFSGGAPGPAQAGIGRPLAFLPDHDVRPGDSWSTQVSQPFWGSAFTYRATSSFLRREQVGAVDAAVVESDATVPVNLTVKVADFASVLSLPAGEIPKDSTATYSGGLDHTSTTSWIDPSNGSLLKTVSRGNFSLQLELHGFPKAALSGAGSVTLSGQLSMQLTQL